MRNVLLQPFIECGFYLFGGRNNIYDFKLYNFVTAEKVKNEFLGLSEDNKTLLDLFTRYNDDVKKLIGIKNPNPPIKNMR